jgi:hypothetical protein
LIHGLPVASSVGKDFSERAFSGTAVLPLMGEQTSGIVEALATLVTFERRIHQRLGLLHCNELQGHQSYNTLMSTTAQAKGCGFATQLSLPQRLLPSPTRGAQVEGE